MRKVYVCPYNKEVECSRKPRPERCFCCGFNPIEQARRQGYIQAGGMKSGPDGLMCLKIHNELRIF